MNFFLVAYRLTRVVWIRDHQTCCCCYGRPMKWGGIIFLPCGYYLFVLSFAIKWLVITAFVSSRYRRIWKTVRAVWWKNT